MKKNLSNLFGNRLESLSNVTYNLKLSNSGLNNNTVVEILDKLENWTKLNELTITYNFFHIFLMILKIIPV